MEKVPEWLRWLWLCKRELNKSESQKVRMETSLIWQVHTSFEIVLGIAEKKL